MNNEELVIRATIDRIAYQNAANGYTVCHATMSDSSESVVIVGTTTGVGPKSHILARGRFKDHPKFGRQFAATSVTETAPSAPEDLERYIGSGIVKGIGARTAKRIVEEFGVQALEVISKEPQKIAELPGVGAHRATLLAERFGAQDQTREVQRFLIENELSPGLVHKIMRLYGPRAVEVVGKHPYRLAREVPGIGFLKADAIAIKIGISPDSPDRIKAGLVYALEKAVDEGHCYLPIDVWTSRAEVLLGLDNTSAIIATQVEALVSDTVVVQRGDYFYLPHINLAEESVAETIADRLAPWQKPIVSLETIEDVLGRAEKETGFKYSAEQREAVGKAAQSPLLLITGGPGCGKTTIIKALTNLFSAAGKRLLLSAPTGRAAQRMSQVCGLPASTIHRMLKFDPIKKCFLHGPNDPLQADAVIVDESSMLDIQLAMSLFSAVPRDATLILVGDKDQLPSVGPGRVFGDLLALEEVPKVILSQLFRRSEESSITSIAHLINAGNVPDIPQPDGVTKTDAYFLPKGTAEEASELIQKLVAEQLPKKFGFNSDEIQVLTPSHRGPLGTVALNAALQGRVNPSDGDNEREMFLGAGVVRVGDRVCQQVNNYDLGETGVFNGDLGTVVNVDRKHAQLWVKLWDGRLVKYCGAEIQQLTLAYAITVHRSQGSEAPCIVMALSEAHYTLLERQLLYTAVTRAKKLLIIVGTKRALSLAARKATSKRRCSDLRGRILEAIK